MASPFAIKLPKKREKIAILEREVTLQVDQKNAGFSVNQRFP